MHRISTLGALAALLAPHAHALFETTYHSSSLAIQPFTVIERSADYDPDNSTLFLICPSGVDIAQPGPAIYKSTGELVWAGPNIGACNDLNFQEYDGEQYLTLWAGNGSATALVTAFNPVQRDLTSVGGVANGWYLDSIIQEIDIATGALLFSWSSVDHIAFSESYNNLTVTGEGGSAATAWDAAHINSIEKDSAGGYLISARNTQTIYKIDKNGTIVWRLGGKTSDFMTVGSGDTQFHFQHHARWRAGETEISVFDDGAAVLASTVFIVDEPIASGKYLKIDQSAMTVSLVTRFLPTPPVNTAISNASFAEGSIEPYGNTIVVNYGNNPWVQVYDASSTRLLFSATVGPNNASLWLGGINSYRAFQTSTHQFTGHPTQPPSVAVAGGEVYVSWSGATHVAAYELLTGTSTKDVSRKVCKVAKAGFETQISASGSSTYIVVEALAANGTVLGKSAVYKTRDGSVAR
ncbi:ASST-domain-containing protein [Mycena latifolia]|nr:ASST-domain-containing protein [Mycena latifolia]